MTSSPIFIKIKFNFLSNGVGFECVGGTYAILVINLRNFDKISNLKNRPLRVPNRSEILPELFLGHTETYKSAKLPLLKRPYFWSTPSAMPRHNHFKPIIFRRFFQNFSKHFDTYDR